MKVPPVTQTVTAPPFTARQCPECHLWIYTAGGPFAEGDRTKTLADWLHWEAEHVEKPEPGLGFPFFPFNEHEVEALWEARRPID